MEELSDAVIMVGNRFVENDSEALPNFNIKRGAGRRSWADEKHDDEFTFTLQPVGYRYTWLEGILTVRLCAPPASRLILHLMPDDAPDTDVSPSAVESLTLQPVGDPTIYRRALTHRSILRGHPNSHRLSNERLEFLGDALLDTIVGEVLFHTFPDEDEGFLTRLRAKLVSKKALAAYARAMDLGTHVLMTENAAKDHGRDNPSILSDAFEALLGAVYLDRGFEAAQVFVEDRALNTVDLEALAQAEENYKSILQETLQANSRALPTYTVVDVTGPSHDRTYTVQVVVDGQPYGRGTASAKQKAEQRAARKALQRVRHDMSPPVGDESS